MKKNLLFLFFISTTFVGRGQNLVPNGDFEQYSGCPDNYSQIDSALYWTQPSNATTDYYNQCDTGNVVGVPNNLFGYQNAHSGVGYGGIVTYYKNNYREYLEIQLLTTLIANTCYHFEMHVSSANYMCFGTDDLGVYFSDTLIYHPILTNLLYTPQINNNTGFITDTLNWVLISGNFTATGGENFLLIGNFKNDINTDSIIANNNCFSNAAYVYIDDVSLTPCTGIEDQNQNSSITIYPNPVKDELFIKGNSLTGKSEVKITDILGKEMYRNQLTSNFKIQTSNYLCGIYFIEINTGKEVYRKKLVKE